MLVEVARMDSGHPWPSPCGRTSSVQIGFPADLWTRYASPTRTAPTNKKSHPGGVAFSVWWRWRESNSRPQALRYEIYMLIPSLISLWATRRAGKTYSQFSKDLTVWALNMPASRSCVGDSRDPNAQARFGRKAFTGF